jgi:hypothetical protein
MLIQIIAILISFALVTVAFNGVRRFVRQRLRFVDAAHRKLAPWIAGVGAAVVTAPVVALVPLLGTGFAISLGLAVGLGVHAGSRDVQRGFHEIPPGEY